MAEIAGGIWAHEKCPTRDIKIAKSDLGTLWLVRFTDLHAGVKGEIAITQGLNAESHARLFAAAPALLEEVKRMHESLVAEIDDLDCGVNWVSGENSDTCEHCQKVSYRDLLKGILMDATGEKY